MEAKPSLRLLKNLKKKRVKGGVPMPDKFQCPVNLKWAKAMVDLYPPGFSRKVDALRECIKAKEQKQTQEKVPEAPEGE